MKRTKEKSQKEERSDLREMDSRVLNKFHKPRPGFSLVELLIVAIIVAILAAAAIPLYTHHLGRAYSAEVKARVGTIESGLILGEIVAKKPLDYDEYKIVAYVRTDVWYAHPWEGASALLGKDGSWQLESVKRTPSPTEIGFFLVEKDYDAPAVVENPSKSLSLTASPFIYSLPDRSVY